MKGKEKLDGPSDQPGFTRQDFIKRNSAWILSTFRKRRWFMSESITRRSFIKGSTVLGASSILGGSVVGWMQKLAFAEGKVDIAAVKGADYFKNTIKAVEILGGMGKFVSKQSKVGLLINSPWEHPGSYVKPEITLAVIQMCRDAGAKEIGVFKSLGNAYWRRSALSEKFRDEVKSIRSLEGGYTEVSVPRGRSLKKAEIAKGLLDCDVFINIPIAKDHTGVRFTGTMKNMMGATSSQHQPVLSLRIRGARLLRRCRVSLAMHRRCESGEKAGSVYRRRDGSAHDERPAGSGETDQAAESLRRRGSGRGGCVRRQSARRQR